MKDAHLTEENLQEYFFNEFQDSEIAMHLAGCPDCRERLEAYQLLIANVKKIQPESFSFEVTALAMDKIFLYEKKKNKRKEIVLWGVLATVSILISSFSIPYLPMIFALFYSQSIFSTLFLIGTGLFILAFLVADIIRQYKKKEDEIFKNDLQPML
jgi:hypothetical protein